MPLRIHSFLTEITAWFFFSLLAVGLALPLVLREHRLQVDDLLGVATGSVRMEMGLLPALPAENPFAVSIDQAATLAALGPQTGLIDEMGRYPARLTWNASAATYEAMIENTARLHQVSPLLVKAVIQTESNFNPRALSQRGAVGLMQVMPDTARAMGISDPWDPQKNVTAGVKYLKTLLVLFNDDEKLALAAYNCGPEAMKRWGNQPPFQETRTFVDRVMTYYSHHLDSWKLTQTLDDNAG